jgi:hypothetical protein
MDPQQTDLPSLSLAGYVSTLAERTVQVWDRFWFVPRDPVVLGLIRICTGLMLLYTHAVWGLQLEAFLGPNTILDAKLVREVQPTVWPSFWWYVPLAWVPIVHWVCLTILALFTAGVLSRITSILALVIAVSYANRLFFATFGLDQINCMLAFYLAIGPAGAALSVDQWLRGKARAESRVAAPPSFGANISTRLIQVHMCVIYFYAGTAKLNGGAWWDGSAMWLAFASYEYQTVDMTWLAWHPFVYNLMSHVTVAWELSFCVLVWFPLLRPLVLALAVPLHLGIGLCLGMWTFGIIMLVGCAAFISPALLRRVLRIPSA